MRPEKSKKGVKREKRKQKKVKEELREGLILRRDGRTVNRDEGAGKRFCQKGACGRKRLMKK